MGEWIRVVKEFRLPTAIDNRVFFYFDSQTLVKNSRIANFDELFSLVDEKVDGKIEKTIIIRTLLEQVRGITTKALMFLQLENQYNNRNLDDVELIFIDTRVNRVADRLPFPNPDNDLIKSIRRFGKNWDLTAKQIDSALYGMGDVCDAKGCLHGTDDLECIFHEICQWAGKR